MHKPLWLGTDRCGFPARRLFLLLPFWVKGAVGRVQQYPVLLIVVVSMHLLIVLVSMRGVLAAW